MGLEWRVCVQSCHLRLTSGPSKFDSDSLGPMNRQQESLRWQRLSIDGALYTTNWKTSSSRCICRPAATTSRQCGDGRSMARAGDQLSADFGADLASRAVLNTLTSRGPPTRARRQSVLADRCAGVQLHASAAIISSLRAVVVSSAGSTTATAAAHMAATSPWIPERPADLQPQLP